MKHSRILILLMLAGALFPLPALAKGDFNLVTVEGPDWYGEIEITDPDTLDALNIGSFLDLSQKVVPPEGLGRGFLLTRGYAEGTNFNEFDRLMYFSGPQGAPGYGYYLEIVNGSGPMDGNWYVVTERGEAALLDALASSGVRLRVDQTHASPVVEISDLMPYGGLILVAFIGGVAGWVLRASRGRSEPVLS